VGAETAASEGLRVRLIGPFEVEGVDLAGLRSRKSRTLLKVLALAEGRPVSVDRLVDCLWGDRPPAKAEREVAVNASRARAVVGGDNVERSDAGYRLRLTWCDVVALAELDDEAQRRTAIGDQVAARAAAIAGTALVRGELLCDEADPWWAEAEVAAVARRVASLRRVSARAALALGALSAAASEAEQALARDPLDEDALRVLMTAQVLAGRSGSALAAYADLRTRLVEELGVGPDAETEALHTAILLEQPLPNAGERIGGAGRVTSVSQTSPGDGPDGDLPGRDEELGALDAALAGLADRPLVLALDGEPGSGKTTVLDAFERRARGAGAVVLRATCDERGLDLPLEPLSVALDAQLDTLGRDERERVLGADAETLGPLLGSSAASAAGLPGPSATPDALQMMVFSSIGRVLARLAGGASLVLLVDDAHRSGPSMGAWLHHVVRRADPVMLVVAARRTSGPGSEASAIEPTRTIPVGPLDLPAARQIVGEERAAQLLERSGGNALFLVELATVAEEAPLPDTVRAAVVGRVTDPEVATSLESAAVLGPEFDLDLLAGVLRRSALEVLDHLEAGLRDGLLQERESEVVFRHALIRDALAAGVSTPRRALLHREAVRVLLDRADADPLVIAHHARLAGEVATAASALADAAALAAARFDLAEAERLLTEAIDLAPSGDLLLQRGRVRLARADLDGADTDATAAVAGTGAAALELRAWVARFRHDMEQAIRLGAQAAQRADDPTTRASALIAVAFAHRGLGDLTAAERDLTDAIATEGAADLGARGWLGVLRVHQGRPAEALELLEPAIGAEVETVYGFWVEHTLQMTAHAYAMTGRVVEALALLDRLERELDRRGSRARYAGLAENYRGWILRNLADPRGLELAEGALEVTSMAEPRTQSMLDLADGHLRAGDLDAAAARLDAADATMQIRWFQHRWRCEARLGLLRAQLGLARHDPGPAAELAAEVAATAEARGDERYPVLARLAGARATAMRRERVDRDAVARDLARLPEVAAMESWWITALVAQDLGEEQWRGLATRYADALARGAGPDEEAFRERAARWLDRS
jgi:DNA-binding SARP family transcriptional activator/tetratricopeptide (TPR) repeat protein